MNRGQLVSVIITTKNEEKTIARLIKSINKQSYRNFEIILVDNNSQDQTPEIAEKMGVKVYNFGPERSAQRNYGAKKAKGKYLLFLDADMELSRKVLNECVEAFNKNTNLGGVAIPEKSKAYNFWGQVKAFERSIYNEKGDPITDAARFFPKKVLFKAGGYDEEITGPEDWDLPEIIENLGFRISRINAWIYHYERISHPLDLAKKKFYYALSAYKYLEKHNINLISAKTIYFLRPIFYKNWKKILLNPKLSLAMFLMLSAELIGGGLGYIVGRIKK
jgi:glycosyltransferase involved in cell wall biosynthesis